MLATLYIKKTHSEILVIHCIYAMPVSKSNKICYLALSTKSIKHYLFIHVSRNLDSISIESRLYLKAYFSECYIIMTIHTAWHFNVIVPFTYYSKWPLFVMHNFCTLSQGWVFSHIVWKIKLKLYFIHNLIFWTFILNKSPVLV